MTHFYITFWESFLMTCVGLNLISSSSLLSPQSNLNFNTKINNSQFEGQSGITRKTQNPKSHFNENLEIVKLRLLPVRKNAQKTHRCRSKNKKPRARSAINSFAASHSRMDVLIVSKAVAAAEPGFRKNVNNCVQRIYFHALSTKHKITTYVRR